MAFNILSKPYGVMTYLAGILYQADRIALSIDKIWFASYRAKLRN